ncbi:MAG: hypothetical protein IPO40_23665 [Fibrobacteres bacterium]|jgi:hypothetical protein|nr:hypothetical protein [Fibrobacterota bacterium]
MKISNGKVLILFGIIHPLLGISPFAFGKQFYNFAGKFFFKISNGLLEFPLLNGKMNYENFAAFWFFYFGLLLIPLGILLSHIEKECKGIPKQFVWSYFIIVLIGVYMIPFSGMTLFMLPHSLYMVIKTMKRLPT